MSDSNASESRFEAFLARVLQRIDDGENIDVETLAAEQPEFASDLRSYFAAAGALAQLDIHDSDATTVRVANDDRTLDRGAMVMQTPERIRYFGDYELVEEIARGGMGVVYRAIQVSLRRDVALKMILAGGLASKPEIERFHREAEAAANLDHPNIVPIYEIGEHAGHHYFAMKLVEGSSASAMREALRSDPRAAATLLVKVAHAVHYAHQRSILHRDLKPSNILIDASGEPYITDFGLARRISDDSGLTQSGAVVGTPSYMAPEQAAGEKSITTAADVYALGAILYDFLCGRPPFRAENSLETLRQVLDEEPPAPRTIDRSIDRDLETIALRCLEKNPARRYSSAEAVADEVERWLRHEPITARASTRRERIGKWMRRRPAVAALSLLVVLSLITGFAGVFTQWRSAQRSLREAEESLYAQQLRVARDSLETGNVRDAMRLLSHAPARLRGWEWHWMQDRIPLRFAVPADRAIQSVTATPDGTLIAFAAGTEIVVHDAARQPALVRLQVTTRPVTRLAFSPDRQRLVAAARNSLEVFALRDGSRRRTAVDGEVRDVSWNGEDTLIVAHGRTVDARDASTGAVRAAAILPAAVTAISVSRDALAATTADEELSMWSLPSLSRRWTREHAGVKPLFSPDGTAVAAFTGTALHIIDAATGGITDEIALERANVLAARWSGQVIDVANPRDVRRIDLASRQIRPLLQTEFSAAAALPQSASLVIVADNFTRAVEVWDPAAPPSPARVLRLASAVRAWTISEDGTRMAFLDDQHRLSVCRIDGERLIPLRTFPAIPPPRRAGATKSGYKLDQRPVTVSQFARLFGSEIVIGDDNRFLRFSRRGDRVLQAHGGVVTVWDLASGKIVRLQRTLRPVTAATFSDNGERIATVDEDSGLEIWSAVDGRLIESWPDTRAVTSFRLQFTSRDAELLEVNTFESLLGRIPGGKEKAKFLNGYMPNLIVSSDGKRATWSPFSPLVYFQELGFFSRLATCTPPPLARLFSRWRWSSPTTSVLAGHLALVDRLAFSPDDQRLATADRDGTIKLWDATSGRELMTLQRTDARASAIVIDAAGSRTPTATREIFRLAFSPDGKRLILGTRIVTPRGREQTEIRTWDAQPARLVATTAPAQTFRRCTGESSLRSLHRRESVKVSFVNHSDHRATLYWIDYAGRRTFRGFVPAHGSEWYSTFATHPWVIADAHDNCIAATVPGSQDMRVDF